MRMMKIRKRTVSLAVSSQNEDLVRSGAIGILIELLNVSVEFCPSVWRFVQETKAGRDLYRSEG